MSRTNTMQQEINRKQTNSGAAWRQQLRKWLLSLVLACTAMPGSVQAVIIWIPDNHEIQGCRDLLVTAIRTGFFNHCVIEEAHSEPSSWITEYYQQFLQNKLTPEQLFNLLEVNDGFGLKQDYLYLFRLLKATNTQLKVVGPGNFARTDQIISELQGNVVILIGAAHLISDAPPINRPKLSHDGFDLYAKLGGVVMTSVDFITDLERGRHQQILTWIDDIYPNHHINVDSQINRKNLLARLIGYNVIVEPKPVVKRIVGDLVAFPTCPICNKGFPVSAALDKHIQRVHKHEKEVESPLTPVRSVDKPIVENPVKVPVCPICQREFSLPWMFTFHKRKEHGINEEN